MTINAASGAVSIVLQPARSEKRGGRAHRRQHHATAADALCELIAGDRDHDAGKPGEGEQQCRIGQPGRGALPRDRPGKKGDAPGAGASARLARARGITSGATAKAPPAPTPPNRTAASGPASALNRPATANEPAPASPTPAACIETARDWAVPSS